MIFGLIMPEGWFVERAPSSYKVTGTRSRSSPKRVWLYFRFPLSFREVEELMLERGVIVSYETVRRWCATFG
jgi:putative transposase